MSSQGGRRGDLAATSRRRRRFLLPPADGCARGAPLAGSGRQAVRPTHNGAVSPAAGTLDRPDVQRRHGWSGRGDQWCMWCTGGACGARAVPGQARRGRHAVEHRPVVRARRGWPGHAL